MAKIITLIFSFAIRQSAFPAECSDKKDRIGFAAAGRVFLGPLPSSLPLAAVPHQPSQRIHPATKDT
jgi:hypothetical protein